MNIKNKTTPLYEWILFDADETLFHFDSKAAIKHMFERLEIIYSEEEYNEYKRLNQSLWIEYQNAMITIQDIKDHRFAKWAKKFNITTQRLNSEFINSMAEISNVLPGAYELLENLHSKYKLGIITNGMTNLQEARLQKTNCRQFINLLIISEEVGSSKPNFAIFDFAHQKMEYPDKKRVLIVGDNPDSDIIGGQNFGFDTCWYNPTNKPTPDNIKPTYVVTELLNILDLV